MNTPNNAAQAALPPDEAEVQARRYVSEYLTSCRMTDRRQIGNYLMKLISVAGVLTAQAEGSAMAAARLMGTAQFLHETMPAAPARMENVQ